MLKEWPPVPSYGPAIERLSSGSEAEKEDAALELAELVDDGTDGHEANRVEHFAIVSNI